MTHSTFGKKGEAGPTRGKTAALYVVTLPDGTGDAKRSFDVATPEAWCGAYFDQKLRWRLTKVVEQPRDWPGQVFCPARRVK